MAPPPKPKRPRVHARSWFGAKMEYDELEARRARLTLERGARRQVIDPETGEVTADHEEPGAALFVTIGDRIMVFGPKIDEIAIAEIVTMYPSGDRCYVAFRTGDIAKTTTSVKLLKLAKKPKAKQLELGGKK